MSRKNHEKETNSDETFQLGGFTFYLGAGELRDAYDKTVLLRNQSAEVLKYLIQHTDKLVSKSDLNENIWPNTHVTDDSLVQCVSDIRRALRDTEHKVIQTIPKRGYKLNSGQLNSLDETSAVQRALPQSTRPVSNKIIGLVIAAFIAVVLGVFFYWNNAGSESQPYASTAHPPLPGKPSIAVLAFDNLTGGTKNNYLSDGLSENIITALARFPDFFVIARNSSFTYKGQPTNVQQIGRELGVQYIVEGSIQFLGEKFRATAQLIDATTGIHIWAEDYDREIGNIFDVQTEITVKIASTLVENISLAEHRRLQHYPTENLGAYELFKRAQEQAFKFSREGNIAALSLATQAVELDPNFTGAYIELAWAHINANRWGWSQNTPRDKSLELAFEMARKAIELEPYNFKGHWVLANATTQTGNLDGARKLYEKAISLNPNSASVLADSIDPLVYSGQAGEAVARMKLAIRLNPHHHDWYLWNLGWSQYFAEDYPGALASIEKMNEVPNQLKRTLAPILIRLGREKEAITVINEFLTSNPTYDIEEAMTAPFSNQSYLFRWIEDLRKLGVPEKAP